MPSRRARRLVLSGLCLLSACLFMMSDRYRPSPSGGYPLQAAEPAAEEPPPGGAYLVPVPLPITGNVDTQVERMVEHVLSEVPEGGARRVIVFEFRGAEGQAGEGTQFERALSLARFLASERLSRVRTVAYLPRSVKGHAVLPVLACEEIIVAEDAELGAAGLGEDFIDPVVRRGYSEISERRRTIPTPVALGMLDSALKVLKVETIEGVRYALEEDLEELQEDEAVKSVETVVREGDLLLLSGKQLRLQHGFASHLADDRRELAEALGVPSIEEDPSLGGEWDAVRVNLEGPIRSDTVNWIIRSVSQRLNAGANFVCVVIDSPGGSPADSVRLATFLAELDSGQVRTVAYVPDEALADAALPALACDHLVMTAEARLGGPGAAELNARERDDLRQPVQVIARAKHRAWSPLAAMIDPEISIYHYSRRGTGEDRYFSPEEHEQQENPDAWRRGREIRTQDGLTGAQAAELGLARFVVSNFAELRQLYQLEDSLRPVDPNWAHMLIERLSRPELAGTLLFVAFFALMLEFMSPGLGIAGFVSGVCFLLFFWANFLHGTAGWLEVLLFGAGVLCVMLELFALPGVGVFGLGGGALIIASIVLASQTFVIPRNIYQLEQLPGSLFMVVASGAGALVAIGLMRRLLPEAPLFNRMMLRPPDEEQLEDLNRRESIVEWSHLTGKRGVATTRLAPSGKARFGDDYVNVISDGELIDRGAEVYVVEAAGNRVVVREITDREA